MGVVGQGQQTTHVYSASIVTSDPSSGIIQAVLPGSLRPVKVLGTPVAFRWPIPGEVWRIVNVNGTFFLDCPLPIQEDSSTAAMQPTNDEVTTINDIAPGDAVLNSPTGKIWVMGSQDGSTDFSFDAASFSPESLISGGDTSGPLSDQRVNTVLGGQTPATTQTLALNAIPSYSNGWRMYTGVPSSYTPYYYVDQWGICHMQGLVDKNGGNFIANEVMFTLPVSCIHYPIFTAEADGGSPSTSGNCQIRISPASSTTTNVLIGERGGPTNPVGWVSLDVLHFRTR